MGLYGSRIGSASFSFARGRECDRPFVLPVDVRCGSAGIGGTGAIPAGKDVGANVPSDEIRFLDLACLVPIEKADEFG